MCQSSDRNSIYKPMKTKQISLTMNISVFLKNKYKTEASFIQTLSHIIKHCMRKHCFSTYPYYVDKKSSNNAIRENRSGNCIALSYGLKHALKKQKIKSVLVPASVPNRYKMDGMFPICHVALCVITPYGTPLIIDPAFYYLHPLPCIPNGFTDGINIYGGRNILERVQFIEMKTGSNNIKEIHVAYDTDMQDKWKYYFIEVLNPDQSISLRYLHIKQEAFICILNHDLELVCMIRQNPKRNHISLYEKDTYTTYKNVSSIPDEIKKRFETRYGMNDYLTWDNCKKFEDIFYHDDTDRIFKNARYFVSNDKKTKRKKKKSKQSRRNRRKI